MANRLKKLMAPLLKEECNKAFKRGFEEGKQAGWDNKVLAYENEIASLKYTIKSLEKRAAPRFLLRQNGDIIPLNYQAWIPVSERLPDVVDSYLVVVKYKYDYEDEYTIDVDVATYNPYEKAYIDDCWNTYNDWDEGQQYLHVTHWMPLPEAPKGE